MSEMKTKNEKCNFSNLIKKFIGGHWALVFTYF